jgi:integrase
MKITAKNVAGLKLAEGKADAIHFDDEMPGFGFRLRRASGERVLRSWVCQYRNGHGKTRRKLIGSAETVSAEQARTEAKKVLAQVALGGDPQAEKKAARRQKDTHSLGVLVADYLAAKRKTVRPRTYGEIARYLTGLHFKPLHSMPIDRITRRDVAGCLTRIIAENGSITAGRARVALSSFFVWALGHGLAEINPVVGTLAPADATPRERVLTDLELTAIWRACNDDDYGRIVRLLALTGCRRQEVGGMRWDEVDLERGIWTIPAARTKNGRSISLPLPRAAIDVIEASPRMAGRAHLFGIRGNVGFSRWSWGKRELDGRAAIAAWHLHDLRRTAATRMADLGVQPHIIEAVLNHYSGHRAGVAGIYNRSPYEREVAAALALWADHLESIVTGTERKVLAFPAGA